MKWIRPLRYEINRSMGTLKPQSNGPLYSKTVIGTLAVDGWAVTGGTAMRGLDRLLIQSPLAVPNVTAHPSTASVPITVSLQNGPLLCGFNVTI